MLEVDLPVISDRVDLPDNRDGFPLCDVAIYDSHYRQPGEEGTTYIYAHAQEGMLLPMLEASYVDDGRAMLHEEIRIFTGDGFVFVYEITHVRRHATDWSLADDVEPGEQRLVIQTSEGPPGTEPKLQVAARPVDVREVPIRRALPTAEPRACPP